MKNLKVKLSAYQSKYYPVQAVFTLNNVRYQLVFINEADARRYFNNRFYPAAIEFH